MVFFHIKGVESWLFLRTTSPWFKTFLPLTPILKKSLTRHLWQHRFCLPVGRCGSWFHGSYTLLRVPKNIILWNGNERTRKKHRLTDLHLINTHFRSPIMFSKKEVSGNTGCITNIGDGVLSCNVSHCSFILGNLPTLTRNSSGKMNQDSIQFNPWLRFLFLII